MSANFTTYGSTVPTDCTRGYNINTPEYKRSTMLRQVSKGPIATKSQKASRGGGPEHIYRDPRMKQRAAQFSRECVTVDFATRSFIKKMADRSPYTASVSSLLEYAAMQCREACNKIIAECRQKNKKFFDKSFYFDNRMNMYPPGSPDDCTVTEPTHVARINELFPGYQLYCEGVSSGDMVQGAIGDCFFVGAVSALGSTTATAVMDPIGRLFAAYDHDCGVYGVLFFKNGGWEWVIVDDIIATYDDGRTPLYATAASREVWPMIIEKAYAKVHYCWDTIDGGWGREALADLTGGIEYTIDLNSTHARMSFDEFRTWVEDPLTILGCAVGQHVREQGGAGRAGEAGAVYGLFKGHAYSVIKSARSSDGACFIRVRNPWGNEAEWTGPYADNAPEWRRNPLHQRELNPEFKADGAFWMKWEDFRKYFTDIDICTFFGADMKCITTFGVSTGRTYLKPENTFILEVKTKKPKARIVASLGQEDPKSQPDHNAAKKTPYAVLRLSTYRLKQVPNTYTEMSKCLGVKMETGRKYNRQVDETLELEPGFYSIVPQLTEAPSGIGYYVRCFCDTEDDIAMYRFDNKTKTFLSTSKDDARASSAMANNSTNNNNNNNNTRGGGSTVPGANPRYNNIESEAVVSPSFQGTTTTLDTTVVPETKPVAPRAQLDLNAIFETEGGVGLAACMAFGGADVWGRGSLDQNTATAAFSGFLMSSELGRTYRDMLHRHMRSQMTLMQFTAIAMAAIEGALANVPGGSSLSMSVLFESEDGIERACSRAFQRVDTTNRGTIAARPTAVTAFSQLLMSSDVGREFFKALQRSGAYTLTQNQFVRICEKALLDGTM